MSLKNFERRYGNVLSQTALYCLAYLKLEYADAALQLKYGRQQIVIRAEISSIAC